ncbi:MAG: amidohydrolase family protein, partial [Emergencia sp.]|nr:amidohydrolase family protein [Emergencia sp.]
MKASIVIKNGHLMTMDEAVSNAEWIALRGEQILAVGCGADYLHYTDRNTRIIDAAGKTVLPGFIDSHFHVAITALGESRISLEGVRNFSEAGQRLKEAAGSLNGKALIATGLDCDKLEEGRFPDRTFLDRYCADIPAAVYSADYHALILNTCGILYFKAPFTLNGIDIDGKGMPTGIFTNQAGAKLDANIFRSASEKEMDAAVRKMIPGLFARGLTTVVAMEGGNMNFDFDENRECEFLYENRRRYPLDMELFYQTTNTDIVEKKNLRRIGGALYVDGTLGRHTA